MSSRPVQPTLLASGHVVLTLHPLKLSEMDADSSVIHQIALRKPQVTATSRLANVNIHHSGRFYGQLMQMLPSQCVPSAWLAD